MNAATATVTANESRTRTGTDVLTSRLSGIGGLVFVAALVVQNLLRAKAPGFDAAPAKVTAYFLQNRAVALTPLGMFPFEMLGLFAFVAGVRISARRDEGPWWATMGALGATAIASLFALVNIIEIVLTAKAENLAHSPAVVEALWAVRGAAFGLDLAAIAVALIGLSRAAALTGLIPTWISAVAVLGAACLLVTAMFTVALTNGGPWLALGLVGFAIWIVFMVVTSVSLIRSRQTW